MGDANQALTTSAQGPKTFSADGQTSSEHDLAGQLAVTKFQMATRARSRGGLGGISRVKLRAPGAVYPPGNRTDGFIGPRGL